MLAPRDRLWSTPAEVVARAVELLQITELDVVYDIGAGDGRLHTKV
jgi:protein-L-isoaspartate O-methyltransferase